MQSAPTRLQQAIWSAFRAAKPAYDSARRPLTCQLFPCQPRRLSSQQRSQHRLQQWRPPVLVQARFYSDKKQSDLERKVEDAKQKIDETIDARADNVVHLPGPGQDSIKSKEDETIIHTLPESSSIVYNPHSPGEAAAKAVAASKEQPDVTTSTASDTHLGESQTQNNGSSSAKHSPLQSPLPSQLNAQYSNVRSRFTHFMDNFQTHVFTASKRLNDLTGYSSIEQLKRDIEAQENAVRAARQHVKDTREAYQNAIATRSDTQREVNDLLHRKHAWSSSDLERFTSLYRSDHANEQAEQTAHQTLSQAEQAYEEASTRLSKSILARYHEEQVWSDKIRQMSTWGTWGLMGLNVLLFVVFQILIEPWRRRRLVRGFEEKVADALREQTAENELRTIFHIKSAQQETDTNAASAGQSMGILAGLASGNIEQAGIEKEQQALAQGTAASVVEHPTLAEMAERTQIEQVAESITTAEIVSEDLEQQQEENKTLPVSNSTPTDSTLTSSPTSTESSTTDSEQLPTPPLSAAPYADLPFLLGTHVRTYLDSAKTNIQSLFDEKTTLSVSQRELTGKMLEGAFFGAVSMVTLFWIVGVGGVRGI